MKSPIDLRIGATAFLVFIMMAIISSATNADAVISNKVARISMKVKEACDGPLIKPELVVKDLAGNVIKETIVGRQVLIEGSVLMDCFQYPDGSQTTILEVRNEQDITTYLAWQMLSEDSGGQIITGVSWTPDKPGTYDVRFFPMVCLSCPMILSNVVSYEIIVRPVSSDNVDAQTPSANNPGGIAIKIWSEPSDGTPYSEIFVYANYCSIFEIHDYADVRLNITSILNRPDRQSEQLDQFAQVNETDCDRVLSYSFIPQLSGDHTVRLIVHTGTDDVTSNTITVRIVSEGIFQSGTVTVILDSEQLRALDHAPDPNYAYAFRVLDWNQDGKSILFGYHDYSNSALKRYSLGILDTQSFNVTRLDLSANNTNAIYHARFSPSGESVFALLGNNSQYPDKPENIFEYNLENRTLAQITNSSSVYWFDTLASTDGNTLIYIDSTKSHFWPNEDVDLKRMFDGAAGRYYYYMNSGYEALSGTGTLDLNEDASKFLFTGEIGGLIGDPEGLDAGIHLVDVLSGESTILTTRSSCVSSGRFAPNDALILYTEHPGESCSFQTSDMGSSLRIASLYGSIDDIVYDDRDFIPYGILSPDGKFIATVGHTSMEDQYPEILIIELPRPVPEFGILLVSILLTSIMSMLIANNRLNK